MATSTLEIALVLGWVDAAYFPKATDLTGKLDPFVAFRLQPWNVRLVVHRPALAGAAKDRPLQGTKARGESGEHLHPYHAIPEKQSPRAFGVEGRGDAWEC